MEVLFDILFESPFVLVAIIGFVSWVFNGIKNAQGHAESPGQRRGRREHPMPSFGGERMDGDREDAPQRATQPKEYVVEVASYPAYEHTVSRTAPLQRSAPIEVEREPDHEHEGPKLDPDAARQGMMWAEVFGPPRSKRPFAGPRR